MHMDLEMMMEMLMSEVMINLLNIEEIYFKVIPLNR